MLNGGRGAGALLRPQSAKGRDVLLWRKYRYMRVDKRSVITTLRLVTSCKDGKKHRCKKKKGDKLSCRMQYYTIQATIAKITMYTTSRRPLRKPCQDIVAERSCLKTVELATVLSTRSTRNPLVTRNGSPSKNVSAHHRHLVRNKRSNT